MSETKVNGLWEALQRFQETCPPIGLDSTGQVGTRHYGYATLPAILRITRPALRECDLIVQQNVMEGGVKTTIMHIPSGESTQSCVDLTEVADMQKLGSAITYARRYGYCTALGLAPDEDDDGAATVATTESGNRPPKAEPVPETPPGWANWQESLDAHNALTDRIVALPEEYRDQMVAYRSERGWPLSKDKFNDLSALVFTAESFKPENDGA